MPIQKAHVPAFREPAALHVRASVKALAVRFVAAVREKADDPGIMISVAELWISLCRPRNRGAGHHRPLADMWSWHGDRSVRQRVRQNLHVEIRLPPAGRSGPHRGVTQTRHAREGEGIAKDAKTGSAIGVG